MAEEQTDAELAEVTETEAMDAEEVPTENGNDAESKEKTAETPKKKNKLKTTIFFLPALHEFKSDMTRYWLSRSVVVSPVDLNDLNKKPLQTLLKTSDSLKMGYNRNEKGEYKGFLQLRFTTEDEAAQMVPKMEKIYKEGVTIKHCLQGSHTVPINYEDVNNSKEHASELQHKPEHSIAIPDLSDDITEEDLAELFPNATLIYIPKFSEEESDIKKEDEIKTENTETETKMEETEATEENETTEEKESTEVKDAKENDTKKKFVKKKRYAYVCFSSAEEATAALEVEINIREQDLKPHKLETMPPVDVIIRGMAKENLDNLINFNQFPQEKKNRLFTMRRQAVHYIRGGYISENKMKLLKQKLDNLSSAMGVKRGGRGGKRGRGAPIRGQGMKRSRQDAFGYPPYGAYGGPGGGFGGPGGPGGYRRGPGYGGYDEWDYGGYGGGYGGFGGGRGRGGRW